MNLSRDDGHAHPDLVHPSPSSTIPSSPPVTDEDFLVKEGSVGTEEGDGVEVQAGVLEVDMDDNDSMDNVADKADVYYDGDANVASTASDLYTDMICLAVLVRVGVVTSQYQAGAGEGGGLEGGRRGRVTVTKRMSAIITRMLVMMTRNHL